MNNTITVIVSKCYTNREGVQCAYGDRIVDESFSDVAQATSRARKETREGVSVIVRPNYNEKDADGEFFREWRSFNGEPLKEVRFSFSF